MASNTGVKGLEEVMVNLNKELAFIKAKSTRGMVLAAYFIRNKMEEETPLTPVDYGNLRSSWFIVTANKKEAGDSYNKTFLGPNAAKLTSDHSTTVTAAQGIVAAQSVGNRSVLMMGYTANYAMYVHEMIGANFNPEKRKGKAVRREGAGAKWLETAIKRNKEKIVQIIRDNAKVL